jgi:hypothetical protein
MNAPDHYESFVEAPNRSLLRLQAKAGANDGQLRHQRGVDDADVKLTHAKALRG